MRIKFAITFIIIIIIILFVCFVVVFVVKTGFHIKLVKKGFWKKKKKKKNIYIYIAQRLILQTLCQMFLLKCLWRNETFV